MQINMIKNILIFIFLMLSFGVFSQTRSSYALISDISVSPTPTPVPPVPPAPTTIYIAVVGNSIVEGAYTDLDTGTYKIYEVAVAGNLVANQLTLWNALSQSKIDSFTIVSIGPLGVNDVASGRTYTQIVADYTSLITAIRRDISSNCKIILNSLTPALGNYYLKANALYGPRVKELYTNYFATELAEDSVDLISTKIWDKFNDGHDSIHLWYNQSCIYDATTCPNLRDYTHPNWLGEQ